MSKLYHFCMMIKTADTQAAYADGTFTSDELFDTQEKYERLKDELIKGMEIIKQPHSRALLSLTVIGESR